MVAFKIKVLVSERYKIIYFPLESKLCYECGGLYSSLMILSIVAYSSLSQIVWSLKWATTEAVLNVNERFYDLDSRHLLKL